MALIAVTQVKPGDKILQDVMTLRNNLLLTKGTVLSEREIEILRAFLISKVHVGTEESPQQLDDGAQIDSDGLLSGPSATFLAFYKAYDNMVVLLKRVFSLAASSGTIPVLEIRNSLGELISHINAYNIVTFKPARYHHQDYLIHHSLKTSLSSFILARWLGFTQKDLIPIALGGLLHDIGNSKVDSTYLQKKSKLTQSEFEEIKQHTTRGYEILKKLAGFNEGTKSTALQHHERQDGSGYPQGLKGDAIHVYSRIVAIVDVYHAMTSPRVYNTGMSPYLVMEELSKESFGKLDPVFVRTFIHKVTEFHSGVIVKLSDNRIGEIVFSEREHPTRPWVKVNGVIVNLTMERSLYIQEVIQ